MKVIAYAGPPGSGKTTHRKNDPQMKDVLVLDIENVYREYPGIAAQEAFATLLNQLVEVSDAEKVVVVEAMMSSDSFQRTWLEYLCEQNEWILEYREFFDIPVAECIRRVEAEWQTVDQKDPALISRFEARLRILNNLD